MLTSIIFCCRIYFYAKSIRFPVFANKSYHVTHICPQFLSLYADNNLPYNVRFSAAYAINLSLLKTIKLNDVHTLLNGRTGHRVVGSPLVCPRCWSLWIPLPRPTALLLKHIELKRTLRWSSRMGVRVIWKPFGTEIAHTAWDLLSKVFFLRKCNLWVFTSLFYDL
jgi:hypothetical protein